jgi:hypothetical protein
MTEESDVRQKAYELWERDGCPEGAEEFYWRLAQEQLEADVEPEDTVISEPVAAEEVESSSEAPSPSQYASENNEQLSENEWPAKGEASRY